MLYYHWRSWELSGPSLATSPSNGGISLQPPELLWVYYWQGWVWWILMSPCNGTCGLQCSKVCVGDKPIYSLFVFWICCFLGILVAEMLLFVKGEKSNIGKMSLHSDRLMEVWYQNDSSCHCLWMNVFVKTFSLPFRLSLPAHLGFWLADWYSSPGPCQGLAYHLCFCVGAALTPIGKPHSANQWIISSWLHGLLTDHICFLGSYFKNHALSIWLPATFHQPLVLHCKGFLRDHPPIPFLRLINSYFLRYIL